MSHLPEIYHYRHLAEIGVEWNIDISRDLIENAWTETYPDIPMTDPDAAAWVEANAPQLAALAHKKVDAGTAEPPTIILQASDWPNP